MNKKLQEIIEWAPFIKKMANIDAAICVWNKEGIVEAYFKSKSINVDFPVGYRVEDPNDDIYTVLRTGKERYNKIPKEAFGVAFEGKILPIFDGREVVGVVTYCVSTEERERIIESTDDLTNSILETEQSMDTMKQGIENLVVNMAQVQKITDLVRAQVEEATSVVSQIQRNANYSSILALNASIESARAGQAGRGFAVVSDEMGKFSKMSEEAAKKINENLNEIVKSLNEVKASINQSTDIATEQSEAAVQLNNVFKSVIETANKVSDICKETNLK